MYSQEVKQELLDILVQIKNKPDSVNNGICDNVKNIVWDRYRGSKADISKFFESIMKRVVKWNKFSGDLDFPVPSTKMGWGAEEMYIFTKNEWEGEYGDLRRELLDFLISEVEKELKE